jgi:hypothetical protein
MVPRLCLIILLIALLPARRSYPESQPTPSLGSLRDLARFVGTFPCSNGLLDDPVLLGALDAALGPDAPAYHDHLGFSGCGGIQEDDGLLMMDVSQLHVGGYSSLIFVSVPDESLYLFWLKGTVSDKIWEIYGPRPIPQRVMNWILAEMNQGWGHVARFTAHGETIEIELLK